MQRSRQTPQPVVPQPSVSPAPTAPYSDDEEASPKGAPRARARRCSEFPAPKAEAWVRARPAQASGNSSPAHR
eukprot:15155551-Alexandrium_andersonii.AAC.1